jgi:hypothetical protein
MSEVLAERDACCDAPGSPAEPFPAHALRHAWDLPRDLHPVNGTAQVRAAERVCVVGGGLTSAQLALLAADEGEIWLCCGCEGKCGDGRFQSLCCVALEGSSLILIPGCRRLAGVRCRGDTGHPAAHDRAAVRLGHTVSGSGGKGSRVVITQWRNRGST